MCTLASYRSSPNTLKDGLRHWNNNSGGSLSKKLSRRERRLYRKHKKRYPRLYLYHFVNKGDKAVKLYSSRKKDPGVYVFNVDNRKIVNIKHKEDQVFVIVLHNLRF